jgi:hypothetical protein
MKTILFAVALFAIPTFAQQHAPTVATCQADLAVWYSTDMATEYLTAEAHWSTDKIRNRTEIAKAPISEVIARQHEMFDCEKVDEQKSSLYHEAGMFYTTVYTDRVVEFVSRHNLWDQFRKEDAEGKR